MLSWKLIELLLNKNVSELNSAFPLITNAESKQHTNQIVDPNNIQTK